MKKLINKIKKHIGFNSEYGPKFIANLKSVCFESSSPINSSDKLISNFNCTAWSNGEGFDISIDKFNTYNNKSKVLNLNLSDSDINGIIACLIELNYFE